MKIIMTTLMALGVAMGSANAKSDSFNDPRLALPRSEQVSNDDYRQALPRTSNDDYRQALPFTEEVFPDIVTATP